MRILPSAEMLYAQAIGQDKVGAHAPGVFTIKADVPEIEVGARQEVLLVEALDFALHKVGQIVSAGVVLWSKGRRAIGVEAVVVMERSACRGKVVHADGAVGVSVGNGLVIGDALQKDASLYGVLPPDFGQIVAQAGLELLERGRAVGVIGLDGKGKAIIAVVL